MNVTNDYYFMTALTILDKFMFSFCFCIENITVSTIVIA